MLEEELARWSQDPVTLAVFISITLLFSFIISHAISRGASSNKRNLPPSPPRLPILGNLHQMSAFPHRSLHSLAQKHGPLMILQLGQVPTLVISSPEVAMEALKTQDHIFSNRPPLKAVKAMSDNYVISFGEYGDQRTRQLKKVTVVHLLSPKKVQSFRYMREEQVALMVESIRRAAASNDGVVDLSKVLNEFTNGIIMQAVTGTKLSSSTMTRSREMLKESIDVLSGFMIDDVFPSLWWIGLLTGLDRKIRALTQKWDSFWNTIMDGPRGSKKDGFIDVLLSLQNDPDVGHLLSKDVIKASVIELYGAGTDTALSVLEWTMSEIVRHPQVLQRAKFEITSVLNNKPSVTEDDLHQMPYLKAAIMESLRMHPPAALLPRMNAEDTVLSGYNIPKNTRVLINVWSIGRDPNWWESPDEFKPERFMDGSSIDPKGQHYQLLPFGTGRRLCPGINFAMASIEVAVANLLYMFDWQLPNGVEALDMEERLGATIRRDKKLELVAKPFKA